MIDTGEIERELSRVYGKSLIFVSDLGGHTDKVFLYKERSGRKYVAKITQNPLMNFEIFRSQIEFIFYLRSTGERAAPRIVRATNGEYFSVIRSDCKDKFCVLWEYKTGKPLKIQTNQESYHFGEWLGNFHRRCESYSGSSLWYYRPVESELEKTDDIKLYINKEGKSFLLPLLKLRNSIVLEYWNASSKLRSFTLNNDLHQTNLIVEKNGNIICLDWNTSARNFLVDEIAWIIAWWFLTDNVLNEDRLKNFFSGYAEMMLLSTEERLILCQLPILYALMQWKNFKAIEDEYSAYKLLEQISKLRRSLESFFL